MYKHHSLTRAQRKKCFNKIIEIVGTQAALAQYCNVTRATISNWKKRGYIIPVQHVLLIESISQGRLKRWQIRPDIYPPPTKRPLDE